MKHLLSFLLVLFIALSGYSQTDSVTYLTPPPPPPPPPPPSEYQEDTVKEETEISETTEIIDYSDIFINPETMPEYPGGEIALRKDIAENMIYPDIAQKNNISGTVFLRFVIDDKGKVDEVMIMRGVSPEIDKEAVRVISSLKEFSPGTQDGIPVKSYMMIPIEFKLN